MSELSYQPSSLPLVTILMNCYNGERYLREAIDSVLGQTYKNWELIFWDNRSTDSSASIFKSYDDTRLKYFYAENHTLLYEARNLALKKANGQLIAFLDVDDCWFADKLERQVTLFANSDVGFACSNYFVINQSRQRKRLAHKKIMPDGNVLEILLKDYYVGLLTLIVRRQAISGYIKTFGDAYHIIGDFDLAIRLASEWKMAYTKEPLAIYRIHGNNESTKHLRTAILEIEGWLKQYSLHMNIGNAKNFRWVKIRLTYLRFFDNLLSNRRLLAFKNFLELPYCALKVRAMFVLFLPKRAIQLLKN